VSQKPLSFIEELKRRNVVRVGVVYLIVAWLLAQVADLMLESFEAPAWVIKVILTVLLIGFPISLIFAWAFELTPEGLKKEKDVDRSQSITPQTGRKLDFMIIGVLAVALGYFIWESRFGSGADPTTPSFQTGDPSSPSFQTGDPSSPSSQTGDPSSPSSQTGDPSSPSFQTGAAASGIHNEKSIAVLPFVNMSSDPEQEFFSDGISEEILNALAKVKELKVAGRTSSFAFKGENQDLRQVGHTLGVEHILEGSVRKSGTKVRITAQLIQVDDGFHLWSESYDRELDDVFAIQDEIASAILEQLKAHLVGINDEATIEIAQRTDPQVYEQYLLAKQRLYERKRLSIETAAELLDKAIAKDPNYAPAYAQRAIAAQLLSEYNYGETKRAEADSQAKLYIDKALQLDPQQAEAWSALGLYHINRPGEMPQAIEALDKALAINPNLIDASNWLQIAYGALGDNLRAMQILEDMVERDPLYPPGFNNAINQYNIFGQTEKSWALIERIRPFLPGDPQILQAEANTWLILGSPAKALPLLEAGLKTQPNDAVMKQLYGWGLLSTGQYEKVVEAGLPWHRAIALSVLGRQEEALMIGQQQAATGEVSTLITAYSRAESPNQLIEFIESRWTDLAAFEKEYPDGGAGYGDMLNIARAYQIAGNQPRFDDAMERIRVAHERSNQQGVRASYFLRDDARYHALAGDHERAIAVLSEAVDAGLLLGIRAEEAWPELRTLAGDPDYEAVMVRMVEHLNSERVAMDLEPVTI